MSIKAGKTGAGRTAPVFCTRAPGGKMSAGADGCPAREQGNQKGVKAMKRKDFYIPSKDGVHRLHAVLWEPDGEEIGRAHV